MKDKIKGGFILLARQLLNSEIWQKPPEYLKVFIYILLNVNHKDTKLFPKGSNFFNFSNIEIKGVSQNQIYDFLRWAKNSGVLTTKKTTRGCVLEVNNYSYFQLLENYKFRNTFQQNSNTINKNVKNDKNNLLYSDNTILSHVVIKKKDCKQSERENFSFSKEDYGILKNFAKKHAKNNFWAYLRSLQRDLEGARNIILEEKRRREIFLKNEEEKQKEKEEELNHISELETKILELKTKEEALDFIILKNKNLKAAFYIPQYKRLLEKFDITLNELNKRKNRKKSC